MIMKYEMNVEEFCASIHNPEYKIITLVRTGGVSSLYRGSARSIIDRVKEYSLFSVTSFEIDGGEIRLYIGRPI